LLRVTVFTFQQASGLNKFCFPYLEKECTFAFPPIGIKLVRTDTDYQLQCDSANAKNYLIGDYEFKSQLPVSALAPSRTCLPNFKFNVQALDCYRK